MKFELPNPNSLSPATRMRIVIAGYAVAILLAAVVVVLQTAFTNVSDRQAAPGMFAFGDTLLFLAVFGVAAIPATCIAFYFLRPVRRFWTVLAVSGSIVAATGLPASAIYAAAQSAGTGSPLHAWSAVAVLRVFAAPLFAMTFFLAGLFAPIRAAQVALLTAAAIEVTAFAWIAWLWLYPS
ncbi:MAG: hypothetical protein K1X53_02165 [Candidatus Sumerlaeaceae bacterium]|nr:hypothetical protein [Candidatus Sumerlaeaceae bacterium]